MSVYVMGDYYAGHERPYSIKLFMNTRRLDSNSVNEDTRLQQTAPFQFVLRTCQSRVPYFSGESLCVPLLVLLPVHTM